MSPDDPRHGTYAGATRHYKEAEPLCEPCRVAHRNYAHVAKKRRRLGYTKRVPTPLVKAHINRLRRAGMTIPSIAERAGIAQATIDNIAHGRRTFVTHATATALAQLEPAQQRPDRVPAWRVERRLQALYALGWTASEMGRRTGWMDRNVRGLMHPRWRTRESVSIETFETFDQLFRDLCMVIPTDSPGSLVARRRAAELGWPTPLAFDDIDDPNDATTESPDDDIDPVVVMRLLEGRRIQATKAEKEAAVRRWVMDGGTERELCEIHGWKAGRYTAGLRLVRGGAA